MTKGARVPARSDGRPLRIALDGLPLQVRSAGIAVYTKSLVRALAEQHPEVEFVLFGLHRRRGRGAALQPTRFPSNVRWATSWAYQLVNGAPIFGLPRLLTLERCLGEPTVYHGTNFVVPRTRGVPVVVTVHDLALLRFPELGTSSLRRLVACTARAARAARLVIAVSQATARDLRESLGIPAEKIRSVGLGCDARFRPVPDSPERRAVLARYGITEPFVLHVGTSEPRKNLPALVDAYARLRATRAGLRQRLVLAGPRGWGHADLQRAVAASGAGGYVDFVGCIDDADLPAVYSAADLFAFPSLYEGFGLPVLEAMACGTPVVTSTAGALPEVAGNAARFVDPSNPEMLAALLGELLADPVQRGALAERGRRNAERFTWERCARETFAVYEEAVGLRGRTESALPKQCENGALPTTV